jgi:hypothetical protein
MRIVPFVYLFITASALAAPPPNADMSLAPWYHDLHSPTTNELCCGIADCRHYPVRPAGDHYEVKFEDQWLPVPREAILDRLDNPTGDYVTCIQREHYFGGILNPRVVCFIKGPRT